MLSPDTLAKIEALAMQVADREGCKIYDIEFGGSQQGRVLRVYIDKEGGVGIDDCANVSRGLNLMLDVEDPIPGGTYHLEVSSPGLERALRKSWHFEQAAGKKVKVKLSKNLESFGIQNGKMKSAKQFTETLQKVDESGLTFCIEDETVVVPLDAVEKAHLVFEIVKNVKKEKH